MKRITTFAALAVFAFLPGLSSAVAEQATVRVRFALNAPRGQAPVPVIKPDTGEPDSEANPISARVRNVGAGQDGSQQRSRTDRFPLPWARNTPQAAAVQQVHPRAVYRKVARRINVAGGVLALPEVAYYGAPVILNVPGVGYVDVPEDEYARLYEKLSSSDSEQVQEAMSAFE